MESVKGIPVFKIEPSSPPDFPPHLSRSCGVAVNSVMKQGKDGGEEPVGHPRILQENSPSSSPPVSPTAMPLSLSLDLLVAQIIYPIILSAKPKLYAEEHKNICAFLFVRLKEFAFGYQEQKGMHRFVLLDGSTSECQQVPLFPQGQALSQGSLPPPPSPHCFELQPYLCYWYYSSFTLFRFLFLVLT